MTKANRQRFCLKVADYLKERGAWVGRSELPECETFLIETIAGQLALTPCPGFSIATVFGRFADIDRAKELVACNPFTGKWNHHFPEGYLVQDALDEFKRNLEELLPK